MKRILLAFLSVLVCTFSLAQESVVDKYLFTGLHPIQMPFLVDSIDVKQQPFSTDKLLQSFAAFRPEAATVREATDGKLIISNEQAKYAAYGLSFYLQADRYTKAQLTIKGAKRFAVYLDNKPLRADASGNVSLSLEPRRHSLTINGLLEKNQTDTLHTTLKPTGTAMIATTTESSRTYDIHDVLEGKRIYAASYSPNGRFILVYYTTTLPGGKTDGYAEVINKATDEVLLTTKQSVSWMPQSNLLYYVQTGMQGRELRTIDPLTHKENVLSATLPEGRFTFAPTEDYLIFTLVEKGEAPNKDLRQIISPEDRQPGWRNRTFLHRYDMQTGWMERLTFGYRSTYLQDISADGRYLLFSCHTSTLTERPFSTADLYKMDLQSGEVETIIEGESFMGSARFSPDASLLLISGSGEAFGGIGQRIAEGQISNMSDTQLFLYNLTTKDCQPLTLTFDPSVSQFIWNKFDKQIYFLATDRDYVHLYTLNPSSYQIREIPVKEDLVKGFSLPTQAEGLLYYGQGTSNSDRLYTYEGKKKTNVCRIDLSAEILKDIQLGEAKDWNFIAEAGDTIHGRFYLPPNFDANKKYPLIVNYYGGTTPVTRNFESRYPHHAYAAQGYVVYVIQPSGAIGFGQEFSARHVNAWGIRTADEIIEGTRKFCDEHAYVDAEKIGCIGASYGGFMTMLLQTKTDIFTAAISHAGISDITSYWGEGYWGYSYSALAAAHSYPWNARELYVDQSPLFHADKINTPILFLHGAIDTNVPIGESIQMFTALKLLGKTTEFVEVAGQDHHILDYDKRIHWTNTIFAWFAKWLKEQPEWWDEQYPVKTL